MHLAQEWKVLDRVPRIRLLSGERNREFVLSHRGELMYLGAAQQPHKGIAILILETGVRPSGSGQPEPNASEWGVGKAP